MEKPAAATSSMSAKLHDITEELRRIQVLLAEGGEIETRLLADFRDAINRVRTTAWAVQQYVGSKATESDPGQLLSVLAGERVRVAYQLCRLLQADLVNPTIEFQKGQLMQLRAASQDLIAALPASTRR